MFLYLAEKVNYEKFHEGNHSKRSRVLEFIGIIYFLSGLSFYLEPAPKEVPPSYHSHLSLFPFHTWGLFFMAVGIISVGAALYMKHALGFFLLMGMSVWWSLLFVASYIQMDYPRALNGALVWLMVGIFIWVISSWPDPPKPPEEIKSKVHKMFDFETENDDQ